MVRRCALSDAARSVIRFQIVDRVEKPNCIRGCAS
jgi:hypothetical protein